MKAVVTAFNQEEALEGASSVITNLRMDIFQALLSGLLPRLQVPAGPGQRAGLPAGVLLLGEGEGDHDLEDGDELRGERHGSELPPQGS